MIASPIAFFNGQKKSFIDLEIPIHDRSFFFGDAVYEVLRVYEGRPFLIDAHLTRLSSSLDAVGITSITGIEEKIVENIEDNHILEGMVYIHISRGSAPRLHSFFELALSPNILIYSKPFQENPADADAIVGIRAITHSDDRWAQCHIKSTNLLANCLIQTKANTQGCKEAILIRDGLITEGTSSNIFLVKDNVFITPALNQYILPGTRRGFLINRLRKQNQLVEERPIKKEEIYRADEIFLTSSIKEATAIIEVDGKKIGNGHVSKNAKHARTLIENEAALCSRQ